MLGRFLFLPLSFGLQKNERIKRKEKEMDLRAPFHARVSGIITFLLHNNRSLIAARIFNIDVSFWLLFKMLQMVKTCIFENA